MLSIKISKSIVFLSSLILFIIIFLFPPQTKAASFYVATNGNDTSNGSQSSPFKTISKCASLVNPGDTCNIVAGTYNEKLSISQSGSSALPISFISQGAILDGTGLSLAPRTGLVEIPASFIIFNGFRVQNSNGRGITVIGSNNTVSNNVVTNISDSGLQNSNGTNNTFNGNEVFHTVTSNASGVSATSISCGIGAGGGWPSALNNYGTSQNNIWSNNNVHDNCGEGIVTASGDKVLGNTFKNNFSVDIYIEKAAGVTVNANIVTETQSVPAAGVSIGDETTCVTTNSTITSNQIDGTNYGLNFYAYNSCSGVKNTLISGNTFINTRVYGIRILSGQHSGSVIENNFVYPKTGKVMVMETPLDFKVSGNTFYYPGGNSTGQFEWGGNVYDFSSWSVLPNITQNLWNLPSLTPLPLVGDVNGDGHVDIIDLGIVIDNYGKSPIPNPKADLNSDGVVDIVDVGILIDNYGK